MIGLLLPSYYSIHSPALVSFVTGLSIRSALCSCIIISGSDLNDSSNNITSAGRVHVHNRWCLCRQIRNKLAPRHIPHFYHTASNVYDVVQPVFHVVGIGSGPASTVSTAFATVGDIDVSMCVCHHTTNSDVHLGRVLSIKRKCHNVRRRAGFDSMTSMVPFVVQKIDARLQSLSSGTRDEVV